MTDISVGQIVAEIVLDAHKFTSGLQTAETNLAATQKKVESASTKTATAEKKLAAEIKKVTQATKEETSETQRINTAKSTDVSETNQQESAYQRLIDKLKQVKSEAKDAYSPAKNLHDILGPMNTILAGFGVTIGVSSLIQAFKDMADNAKLTRDRFSDLQQALAFQEGQLSDQQMKRVKELMSPSELSPGFADSKTVSSAIYAVDKLYADVDEKTRTKLAETFLGVSEVIGQDVISIIQDVSKISNLYDIPADQVGNLTDQMRKLQQATGTSVSDITSIMYDYQEVFTELGVTAPEQIANLTANLVQANRGDTQAVRNNLKEFSETYKSEYAKAISTAEAEALAGYDSESGLTQQEYLASHKSQIDAIGQAAAQSFADSYRNGLQKYLTADTSGVLDLTALLVSGRSSETTRAILDSKAQMDTDIYIDGVKDRLATGGASVFAEAAERVKNGEEFGIGDLVSTVVQAFQREFDSVPLGDINIFDRLNLYDEMKNSDEYAQLVGQLGSTLTTTFTTSADVIANTYNPQIGNLTGSLNSLATAYNNVADARDRAGV